MELENIEEELKTYNFVLDNYLRKIRNYKAITAKADDALTLAEEFHTQLERFTKEIEEKIWFDDPYGDGPYFNEKPIIGSLKHNTKVLRLLKNYERIKSMIKKESESVLKTSWIPSSSPDFNGNFEEGQGQRQDLLLKEKAPDEEEKESNFKVVYSEAEVEMMKAENEWLEKSIKIAHDIDEINQDMSEELVLHRVKLQQANKEAVEAAENSAQALKEVKKKAKGKWWLFGLKTTLFGGASGAVAGGVVGTVPGAIIGGAAGATGGAVIGSKIKKAAKKKVDKFQEQKAVHIDDTRED